MWAVHQKEIPQRPEACVPSKSQHGNRFWSLLMNCWLHKPESRLSMNHVQDVVSGLGQHGLSPCHKQNFYITDEDYHSGGTQDCSSIRGWRTNSERVLDAQYEHLEKRFVNITGESHVNLTLTGLALSTSLRLIEGLWITTRIGSHCVWMLCSTPYQNLAWGSFPEDTVPDREVAQASTVKGSQGWKAVKIVEYLAQL